MKRFISPAACAAAVILSGVSVDAILTPVAAQGYYQVDFDTFHDALAPYGDWVYSDRWGEVWIPTDVPGDFRPYDTDGYWVYTDEYGWMWVSDYDWGDIPFHYGRWVFDPDDGWMWIPGYVWSPAWVIWRSNGDYIGWMPMPPDSRFLAGSDVSVGLSFGGGFGLSFNFGNRSDYYGYAQWYGPQFGENRFDSLWVFVGAGHLDDRDFRRYRVPRAQYATIIGNTKNITNYTISNNYVLNKSIDPRVVERASGHPVPVVRASQYIKKPQLITTANQGRDIQQRMRTQIPHGSGAANSAPAPSPQVVQSLSTKIAPRNGHSLMHVYTRGTVTKAPLANGQNVSPPFGQTGPTNAPSSGGNAGGTMGPGGQMHLEHEKHIPQTNVVPTTKPGGPGMTTPTQPTLQSPQPSYPSGASGPATGAPQMLQRSGGSMQKVAPPPPKSGEAEKEHKHDESNKPQ